MTTTHLDLSDLTIQFMESGPIREMVELAFDAASDRALREGLIPNNHTFLAQAHDVIIPQVFIFLIERSGKVRRKGEEYVISSQGQQELPSLVFERLRTHVSTASLPIEVTETETLTHTHTHTFRLAVASPAYSIFHKLKKFLFP